MGGCLSIEFGQDNPYPAKRSKRLLLNGPPDNNRLVNPKVGDGSEALEQLVAEAKRDAFLLQVPGRRTSPGASGFASLHTEQGMKGGNQDTMLAWEGYLGYRDVTLVGVFDGHGPYGHLVAKRLRDSLASHIAGAWVKKAFSSEETDEPASDVPEQSGSVATDTSAESSVPPTSSVTADGPKANREEGGQAADGEGKAPKEAKGASIPRNRTSVELAVSLSSRFPRPAWQGQELRDNWRKILTGAYQGMDREICLHPCIDPEASGAAAVLALRIKEDLILANLGDSRCVLATKSPETGQLMAYQLTEDHKCQVPRERDRIRAAKGRVFALEDEPNILRVWLPNVLTPGLAMSRAFGDFSLKNFGISAEPDVTHTRLTPADKFLIFATDGLWDVVTNQEAVLLAAKAKNAAHAAKLLVDTAKVEWAAQFPNSRRDDCTAVVLFLDGDRLSPPEEGRTGVEPGFITHNVSPLKPGGNAGWDNKTLDSPGDTLHGQHNFATLELAENGLPNGKSDLPDDSPVAKLSVFDGLDSETSTTSDQSDRESSSQVFPTEDRVVLANGLKFERNDSIGNLQEKAKAAESGEDGSGPTRYG